MKVAALDLGSNTFLLLIAEIEGRRVTKVYHDECRVTRLAHGVDRNRMFHPDALARAQKCLTDYAQTIQNQRPEKVLAVATSAARDVRNQGELIGMLAALGIPVQIIPGHLEAKITYHGAVNDLVPDGKCRVIDIGGGSTEFIVGQGKGQLFGQSLDVGSVRMTEQMVTAHPISASELHALRLAVRSKLAELDPRVASGQGPLIAVAGTPTTLAAVILGVPFEAEKIHGYRMSADAVERWLQKMGAMTVEERARLPGMEPLRADVIVTGLVILAESMRHLGATELIVSTRGVRFGVAMELANENSELFVG